MRFYLIRDAPVHFSRIMYADADGYSNLDEVEPATTVSVVATTSIRIPSLTPIMSVRGGEDDGKEIFWDLETVRKCGENLMSQLRQDPAIKESMMIEGTAGEVKMYVRLVLFNKDGNAFLKSSTCQGTVDLSVKMVDLSGLVLKGIHRICGDKVKITTEMFFKTVGGCSTRAGLVTNAMEICDNVGGKNRDVYCEDPQIFVTDLMLEYWKLSVVRGYFRGQVDANFNIILTVDDDLDIFSRAYKCETTRKILDGAIESDFEIVASNGAVLKCHKSFLVVNSPVLSTMLQSSMSEKRTSRMEMPDMTEAGVRALLSFLYCDDLDEPKGNLDLAFELLQAGHKYEISRLESRILTMLCNKPDVYFTAEFAIELFLFVRNIPNGEALKEKTKRIVNIDKPIDNPEYDELCQNHARELLEPDLSTTSTLQSTDFIVSYKSMLVRDMDH